MAKPRRPWPRAERVAGEEPRAAAVTPARIARAMDVPEEAWRLSTDQTAQLLSWIWEHYPELRDCPEHEYRLHKATRTAFDKTWPKAAKLVAIKLGLSGNLKAIQYILHNTTDPADRWSVPTPVQLNTGDQHNNILVQVGVTPEEAQAMLMALREAGVLK